MHYELWRIAEAWAPDHLLPADALFDEMLAAFWRGEFEHDGKPTTVLLARNYNAVHYAGGDRSFAGSPIARRLLLEMLCQDGAMPECGIGEALGTHPDRKALAERCILWGDDPAALRKLSELAGRPVPEGAMVREEAYRKLAAVPFRDYPADAQEFLRNLAVAGPDFERWLHDRGYGRPGFLDRMTGRFAPADGASGTSPVETRGTIEGETARADGAAADAPPLESKEFPEPWNGIKNANHRQWIAWAREIADGIIETGGGIVIATVVAHEVWGKMQGPAGANYRGRASGEETVLRVLKEHRTLWDLSSNGRS